MKAQIFIALGALFLNFACGSSSESENGPSVTPPLPFTEVAGSFPLTSGPLADHLIYANDVPSDQVATIRSDLSVVDSWPGVMTADERIKLQSLLNLPEPTPNNLSLWFKARMKYVLSSDLSRYELGLVFASKSQVGLQEFGSDEGTDDSNTGAGNIGTAIYLTTKDEQRSRQDLNYIIIHINDKWVPVLSPRVGLMRIGPAFFAAGYQVNQSNIRALSNSLQRLEIMFHEARHSDGNSAANSVGFAHINCPADGTIPDYLVGSPACDDASNGAYSVGAAVLKPLLHLCDVRCSLQEREVLKAIYIDRLSRVTAGTGVTLKTLDPTEETGFNTVNFSAFEAFNLR